MTRFTETGTTLITATGPLLIDPNITFNRLKIENFDNPAITTDGGRFSVSTVSVVKTILPTDLDLVFQVTATDNDGDTSAVASLTIKQVSAGSTGTFTLNGFAGVIDDVIAGSTTIDVIDGLAGFDIADYRDSTTALSINLNDAGSASGAPGTFANPTDGTIGGGHATGDSLAGTEGLMGGSGDDSCLEIHQTIISPVVLEQTR